VDRRWARLVGKGIPIIGPIPGERGNLLVTFVWRPNRRVVAASVFTPLADFARGETQLQSLGVGGVWYRSFRLSRRTCASYGFSSRPLPRRDAGEKAWFRYLVTVRPDPLNSRHIVFAKDPYDPSDFTGTHSVLELPGVPAQPWSAVRQPSRWKEERHRMRSRYIRGRRTVFVFLPSGFRPEKTRYNLLIAFDGILYRDTVPTPRIVENLVAAGRLRPTVVVLVGNAPDARTKELGCNPAFAAFLSHELLPWLRRPYGLSARPSQTVLAGSSLGGVASAHAALLYPRLFGNVLAQSGAFHWAPAGRGSKSISLHREYARASRLPLRFYLDAGTRESTFVGSTGESLLGSVRHMRDVLEAKGYPVTYAEFEGGHDHTCWRGTLADGIIALLGRESKRIA